MPSHPERLPVQADIDNLRRRADIRRALEMNPDRDEFIVEALYAHFVAIYKRQPVGDEFPEYVYLISSTHEWAELMELFSPHSPLTAEEKEARLIRRVPSLAPGTMAPLSHRPGRPGWTAELFRTRYEDACEQAVLPLTYRSVAQHFVALDGTRGTSPEYLRKLVRRFGRPPR
jgi:hypothetical protein